MTVSKLAKKRYWLGEIFRNNINKIRDIK